MSEQIKIEVDESLSDLIPGFLARKRVEIKGIIDAVARHDYDNISRTAHRLKGEGGSYGFDAITEMARLLEQAVAIRDDSAIMGSAQKLQNYVTHVEVVFRYVND
jgi:HPt (histidine-containing phosphotransfer) domain-containing protein